MTKKYLVILGSTSGVGQECAKQWLTKGGSCILVARNKDKLATICNTLNNLINEKQEIINCICDVTRQEEIDELLLNFNSLLKNKKINALIYAMGYGKFSNFNNIANEEIEKMFKVNTFGMMQFNKYFANYFKQQGNGHIINIVSMSGKIATPKSSLYSATKFAMIGYCNSLRLELAPFNVFVTTINPGPIKTDFFEIADPNGNYLDSVPNFAILEPQKVAQKIINCIGKNRREINIPKIMAMGNILYQVFGRLGDLLSRTMFNKK